MRAHKHRSADALVDALVRELRPAGDSRGRRRPRSCGGGLITLVGLLILQSFVHPLSAADAPAPATPKRGGVLRLAWQHELASIDPALSQNTDDFAVGRLIFRGLFDYDEHDQLVLEQAQDWSLSTDKKTYTFHLRPDVRFANGREVQAEDYVFAIRRVLDPKTASVGQAYLLGIRGAKEFIDGKAQEVSGLRALDTRTLVIELTEPSLVFQFKLALPYTYAVPREIVGAAARHFRDHLMGSGPYVLREHQRGLRWGLSRNLHYAGPDGYPDEVEIVIGGDAYLHTMMVERGETDFSRLSPQDLLRLRRDRRWRELIHTISFANLSFIFMNTELKPFDNVLVRRAVNHAVNRERLARLQPPSASAHGVVPPSMSWANPELRRYEYSPEQARALLREAGYEGGFETDFWYILGYLGRIPETIQEDLRQVGIKINLRPLSSATIYDKVTSRRQASMGLWGWVVDFPDASSFFDPSLNGATITDQHSLNYTFYNNPEVNRLIVAADRTFDSAARLRLLQRMESLVLQDAPWAPIVHEQRAYLCNPRLHGLQAHPVWLYRLEKLWLDQ